MTEFGLEEVIDIGGAFNVERGFTLAEFFDGLGFFRLQRPNIDERTMTFSLSDLPPKRRVSILPGVSVRSVARLP